MYIPGNTEMGRLLRRVLIRRALLMLTLLLRSISHGVRRRFPTLEELVKQGLYNQSSTVVDNSVCLLCHFCFYRSYDPERETDF